MPTRQTGDLHRHRQSVPGSTYFVTCCSRQRKPKLIEPFVAAGIKNAAVSSDSLGDTATLAFTVMPDHCHWLFTLGPRLSFGRVLARFKTQTNQVLINIQDRWQRDFYEHELRSHKTAEPYALYIFLNPYRAALIKTHEIWPYWWCPQSKEFTFSALLNPSGSPPPEWIGESIPDGLHIGE